MDTNSRTIIPCKPQTETCLVDNTRYFWTLKEPKCNLYQIQNLAGQLTKSEKYEYERFKANNSLILLNLRDKINLCDRQLYRTDFKSIFVLDIETEEPIQQEIEPIHISILTEVGVRDKYIYSRLRSDFIGNMKQLAEVHCKHHKISQLQLTRLMSKIRSKSSEVFSIFPNSGKYIANIGETIYHFTCPRKILRPIFLNDNKC